MIKKGPIFSIVVTAYNQEKIIQSTITSVLKQSLNDFELIIVDDYSTDNTRKVIDKLKIQDSRIKVIEHNENKSVFISRIDGVKAAKGQYILFLDGDDSFFENSLELLYTEVISKEEFDVCEFSYLMSEEKQIVNPIIVDKAETRLEYFCKSNPNFLVWNKLYKSSIIKKAFSNIPEGYMNIAEDWYQSICIAVYTNIFVQKDLQVYNYNTEAGITTQKYTIQNNIKNFKSIKCVLSCLKEFLNNHVTEDVRIKLLNNIESLLYSWATIKIKYQTVDTDIISSYLLLPVVFDNKYIIDDFTQLYSDAYKYRNGKLSIKNLLRNVYHKIKKFCLKK